ncbi:MAG: hypothetical protein ACLGG9_05470 [Thermoleophilia bacterium]|jgi:hypothetical protein
MSTAISSAGTAGVSSDVREGRRTIVARDENLRHVRHGGILERWPIVGEGWAEAVEETRLGAIDRTPGAASFGR